METGEQHSEPKTERRMTAEERMTSVSEVVTGMAAGFGEMEKLVFSLRYMAMTPEQKQHAEDMAAVNAKLQESLLALQNLMQPAAAKLPEPEKALVGIKVLLADDDDIIRLIATKMLKRNGADVDMAVNGKEAVQLATKHKYDIILLDAKMPEMNGLDAAWNIRQKDAATPIICVTANSMIDGDISYGDAGMNDTVTKPYNEKTLTGIVTRWVNRSKSRQAEQAGATALYSVERLEAIGDDAFIARMLELFATQVPSAVESIRQAYDTGDFETIKYAMHRIRPSILNMGIESLQTEVLEIESLAEKKERTPVLEAMISKLETVITEVVSQINKKRLTYMQ